MNIDGHTPVLTADDMRELGFTDRSGKHWYFCARVGPDETLNITIDKATGEYSEYVLDENFGQPAYYGRMVKPYRTNIRDAVDREIAHLRKAGLDVVVNHRLYGFDEVQ